MAGAFDIFTRLNLHGASKTSSASILTSSFFQYIYGAWTPQRTLALIQEKQIKL